MRVGRQAGEALSTGGSAAAGRSLPGRAAATPTPTPSVPAGTARLAAAALAAAALAACHHAGAGPSKELAVQATGEGGGGAATPCDLAAYVPLHLAPTATPVAAADLDFAVTDPHQPYRLTAPKPAGDGFLQLDVCLAPDGVTPTLARVQFKGPHTISVHPLVVLPSAAAVIAGLGEVMADPQQAAGLTLDFPDRNLLVKGWKTPDGRTFVTASQMQTGASGTLPIGGILYGQVAFGAAPLGACGAGLELKHAACRFGALAMAAEYCSQGVQVGSTPYSVLKLTLTDTSPAAPAPARGVAVVLDAAARPGAVTTTSSHHNDADTMTAASPGLAVAWSSAHLLTVSYGAQGQWQTPFRGHFLFDCMGGRDLAAPPP